MADLVYLTPAEWADMAQGIDFSDLTDPEMEAIIERASLLAESAASLPMGGSWLETDYVNEQHPWRHNSRRVYLYNWPVTDVTEVRLRVGASTSAAIQGTEIYTNNSGRYIEISALALAFGIAPAIVSLGLAEPEVEVDYTAGYATIPDDLKTAVAIIASAQLVNKQAFEEGTAGVASFTIGSYMVSFSQRGVESSGLAGFSNYVPDAAKLILRGYKHAPFLR